MIQSMYDLTGILAPDAIIIGGHAAIFNEPDLIGDVICRGAFIDSLARIERMPLLNAHDARDVLGHVIAAYEDQAGLMVLASLISPRDTIKVGTGLSFGFRIKRARNHEGGGRLLFEVELIEISLTINPEHPLARVNFIISNGTVQ